MSVRVITQGNNPITDNYSIRDNINQICSEPPRNFATTDAPTGMAMLRQITQYQQERAQTYERFLNDYPIMSDILSAAMPPERQVCKADQEDNLHYLDSALAYARAQQVPVEEESSFFGTLGEIALAIIAIPFSIAGCSSEDPKEPVYKISNGNFCDYDDECESDNCAKVGNEYFCKPWDYKPSDSYDAGSNAKKSYGELCSSHNECESGLCDWDGWTEYSCREKRELEEWCTDNYQCASGNCYNGDCHSVGYQAPPVVCDKDKDGHENKYISSCHGNDCNDDNPNIYGGAIEIKGDGIDENCNFYGDEDSDNDGVTLDEGDCEDYNPNSGPWNNCGGNGCDNCNHW